MRKRSFRGGQLPVLYQRIEGVSAMYMYQIDYENETMLLDVSRLHTIIGGMQ